MTKKTLLITGSSGFVGTHLRETFSKEGWNVIGLTRHPRYHGEVKGSILSRSLLNEIIEKHTVQYCIHLAGESIVEKGQEDPYNTFHVNIDGTLNILEAARVHEMKRVIIASTSHVYGNNRTPYYEGYPPHPSRPYETSKACTDLMAQSYADTFHLPVVIARFVNIFGPGDLQFSRIIPKTMKAILTGKEPTMWGGGAVRDYLHISDAVNAYRRMLTVPDTKLARNRIFNFGGQNRIDVKTLMQKMIALSDESIRIKKIDEAREDELPSQYVSWNKAKKLLGWEPKVTIDDGLKKTYDWYKIYFHEQSTKK